MKLGEKMFKLLPALYQIKDSQLAQLQNLLTAEESSQLKTLTQSSQLTAQQQHHLNKLTAKAQCGPLQSLLLLLAEQIEGVADNLEQLYDDLFIETCAPWVISYIGDLIGYQSVNEQASATVSSTSTRADVANTISFRRRKGTILMLEQLARDTTNWGAHAVEFFRVLGDTQFMNHIRPDNFYSPDLRDWRAGEYINSAFDGTSHTVDVRRISTQMGRYNIQNIGIFLWSLTSCPLTNAPLAPVEGDPHCFRFSSLGQDMPLFNNPVPQGTTITAAALPQNVPNRLRRRVLCHDIWQYDHALQEGKQPKAIYFGAGNSLSVTVGSTLLTADKVQICNLEGNDGSWSNRPAASGKVAIDPHLGRIALPPDSPSSTVTATYYYGLNGDMGGGEYPRTSTFIGTAAQRTVRVPHDFVHVRDALLALSGDGIIEIGDNGTYTESGLTVPVGANGTIELRAANNCRPTLYLGAPITVAGGANGTFALNGLVVTFDDSASTLPVSLLHVPSQPSNQLGTLELTHCTVVPGWSLEPDGCPRHPGLPSLLVENTGLNVKVTRSIVGGLQIGGSAAVKVTDSIVDATTPSGVAYIASLDNSGNPLPGGALTLEGCTIIGKVYATSLSLVENSIFLAQSAEGWNGPLWAARKQQGCVRFSYLPGASLPIPRSYKCAPSNTCSAEPLFLSLRFGDPGYCTLLASTDDCIRRGADDGGEMGAFHFLLAPLRETNLRIRLQEYMPVGLEYGIFYESERTFDGLRHQPSRV